MLAFVATVLLATGSDPALLAPGPDELSSAFERTEWLLSRSGSIERALSRVHNRFAALSAGGAITNICEHAEARSLAARSRALGNGLRDSVQSTRAQQHRLDRVYAAPTLAAVIDAKIKRRHEQLRARVRAAEQRWAELRAWHHQEIERVIKRCKPPVELVVTAGLGTDAVCAGDECAGPVAILGIGGGRICPSNQVANRTVVVIPDGQACYGESDCSCVPTPVLPSAVLGP